MLCTHLTTQENQTKLRRDLTWLAWLENSIDLDAPLSQASTLSHSQSCCWGVLSIFDSFTPSCLGISLPPCTVRFTCFLIRIISCPLTSITLLIVENLVFNVCSSVSPCLDLTSSVWHWSRASWSSASLSSSTFSLSITLAFVTCHRLRFLRIWVVELLDRKRVTFPLPELIVTVVLFLNVSFFLKILFDLTVLFLPFIFSFYIPSCHSKKHVSPNNFRFCCLFFFFERKKRFLLVLPVFSTSLHNFLHFFIENFVLTYFFWNFFF